MIMLSTPMPSRKIISPTSSVGSECKFLCKSVEVIEVGDIKNSIIADSATMLTMALDAQI